MSITNLFNKTAEIYTRSSTTNQLHEKVKILSKLENISCRVNDTDGKEEIFLDNIATRVDKIIFTEYKTTFNTWDEILIDGIYYKIFSIKVFSSYSNSHHLELKVGKDIRR